MTKTKRFLIGYGIILGTMLLCIVGFFLYEYLCQYTVDDFALSVIFNISGGTIGFIGVLLACYFFSNNMDQGIKE